MHVCVLVCMCIICLCVCPTICMYICLSNVHRYVRLFVCFYVRSSVYPYSYLSVSLFLCLSLSPSLIRSFNSRLIPPFPHSIHNRSNFLPSFLFSLLHQLLFFHIPFFHYLFSLSPFHCLFGSLRK